MSFLCRKYDPSALETVFRHAVSGKVLCRLDVKLSRIDFEQLQVMIAMVFRKGMEAGSTERAAAIRDALGLEEER